MPRPRARTLSIRLFEKRLFMGLVAALVLLGVLYSYFLVTSVVNVIVREEMEYRASEISSRLSSMEYEYIKRQDAINIGLARALGFVEAPEKEFVQRRSVVSQGVLLGGDVQ